MHVHINHMFCTDSNWGGTFWSRYMVSLDTLRKVHQTDCANLLVKRPGFDDERWQQFQTLAQEKNWTPQELEERKAWCTKDFHTLKPEVLEWLAKNVADGKDRNQPQGWCVGSESYHMRGDFSVNIWFIRRKDAMEFIRTFSVHQKPTTYFDYFKEIRKELNLQKKVLQVVDEYSKEIRAGIYD